MIFDKSTRKLYADDGSYIKTVNCPLDLGPNDLPHSINNDKTRLCEYCNQEILNVGKLSDEQVLEHLRSGAYRCVFATSDANNIKYVSSIHGVKSGKRVIGTARSIGEINAAVKEGYWPLIKKINYSEELSSQVAVYQNIKTGEILFSSDLRCRPDVQVWAQVIEMFCYYPYYQKEEPIAAYLLPKNLKIGEEVLLEDLIEDIVELRWNQGPTTRRRSTIAVWNGKDFEYDSKGLEPGEFNIMG